MRTLIIQRKMVYGKIGKEKQRVHGIFLEDVISDYRPVCIRKDGIELVDDVGGIYGFCDMLKTICCKSIAVS